MYIYSCEIFDLRTTIQLCIYGFSFVARINLPSKRFGYGHIMYFSVEILKVQLQGTRECGIYSYLNHSDVCVFMDIVGEHVSLE